MDILKMKSDHLTFLLKILQWLSIMCRIKSVLGLAYTAFVSHVRLYISDCSELKIQCVCIQSPSRLHHHSHSHPSTGGAALVGSL